MIHSDLQTDVFICILQVGFTALCGLTLLNLLLRFKSSTAVTTGYATVCLVVVMTFAIVLPMPRVSQLSQVLAFGKSHSAPTGNLSNTQLLDGKNSHFDAGVQQTGRPNNGTVGINFSQLRDKLNWLLAQSIQPADYAAKNRYVAWALGACILLGLIRFLSNVRELGQLTRNSCKTVDDRLIRTVAILAPQIDCQQGIELRESASLECAAVLGWKSPKILLPIGWREWTDQQLRCVLAHELAHIRHNDFAWRLLSCFITSLHFFNPLLHMLVRRLALAQELNADMVAAKSLGTEEYVRCLSQLALQREGSNEVFSGARIAPVFSGYLIRRIKMLKTDSVPRTPNSGVSQWATIGLMLLVGFVAFAAKAVADPEERIQKKEPRSVERVARVTTKLSPAASEVGTHGDIRDISNGMFQNDRLDAATLARNQDGLLVIRLSELRARLKTKELGVDRLFDEGIADGLQEGLSSEEKPTFDVSMIETVVSDVSLDTQFRPKNLKTGEPNEHPNLLGFGAKSFQVIFNQASGSSKWISDFAPKVKTHVHDDRPIHVLSMGAWGPFPFALANLDEKTVLIKNGPPSETSADKAVQGMVDLLELDDSHPTPKWLPAFHRVEGGLISVLVTNTGIKTPAEFEKRFLKEMTAEELVVAKAGHRLEHTFETLAIGVDVSDDSKSVGFRLRLGAANKKAAEMMLADLNACCDFCTSDTIGDDADAFRLLLGSARPELVENTDKTWEVTMENVIKVPGFLPEMAAMFVKSELGLDASASVD